VYLRVILEKISIAQGRLHPQTVARAAPVKKLGGMKKKCQKFFFGGGGSHAGKLGGMRQILDLFLGG
jgi:hypothetical protein